MAGQQDTPYLDALRAYAGRNPGRFHVPGHKGGAGADPGLVEAFGERVLALDIPAFTHGIDMGEEPTPFQEAQRLAAEAWGARRTWWLVNGASQGNHVALLTLAHSRAARGDPAERPLEHDRRADHVGRAADVRLARSSTRSFTSPTA